MQRDRRRPWWALLAICFAAAPTSLGNRAIDGGRGRAQPHDELERRHDERHDSLLASVSSELEEGTRLIETSARAVAAEAVELARGAQRLANEPVGGSCADFTLSQAVAAMAHGGNSSCSKGGAAATDDGSGGFGCFAGCSCSWWQKCYQKLAAPGDFCSDGASKEPVNVGMCSGSVPVLVLLSMLMFCSLLACVVFSRLWLQWEEVLAFEDTIAQQASLKFADFSKEAAAAGRQDLAPSTDTTPRTDEGLNSADVKGTMNYDAPGETINQDSIKCKVVENEKVEQPGIEVS